MAGLKPYWQRGNLTLYLGKAEDVLSCLPPAAFDLVFTSPPYNLGTTTGGGFPGRNGVHGHYRADAPLGVKRGGAGKWSGGTLADGYDDFDDALPHDEYVAWQHTVLRLCWERLTDTGAIFYNHKSRVLDGRLVEPNEYIPADLLPYIRQKIVWARAGGVNFSPAFYLPTHELITIIARPAWRLRDKAASGAGDVWYVPQEGDTPHPAPFPLELPRRAIETTAPRAVLDPFAGWLTTLLAARNAGIVAVGIERVERFCELGITRLEHGDAAARRPQQGVFSL